MDENVGAFTHTADRGEKRQARRRTMMDENVDGRA